MKKELKKGDIVRLKKLEGRFPYENEKRFLEVSTRVKRHVGDGKQVEIKQVHYSSKDCFECKGLSGWFCESMIDDDIEDK